MIRSTFPLPVPFVMVLIAASTVSDAAQPNEVQDTSANGAKVLFQDDFELGNDRWEILDPATWKLTASPTSDGARNQTLGITARASKYSPPTRSPGHVALVRDLEAGNVEIRFRVRSTLDTGNHRDCCVFFGYQDASHFYYVHLGAKPDPHSGQIMIVDDAPRLALTKNETRVPWDDDWHNVLLRRNVETGSIDVYFDDMTSPLMTTTDQTFGVGRVGIGSFDDLNEFDDVTITTF